jgi:hypothetical protein
MSGRGRGGHASCVTAIENSMENRGRPGATTARAEAIIANELYSGLPIIANCSKILE